MSADKSVELLGWAASCLQVSEVPGSKHDSRIVAMLRAVGIRRGGDETPWCAAFANWVCDLGGVPGTDSARARSFQTWGRDVAQVDASPGDVVVLWRGKPDSWQGHVAFFMRYEGPYVWLLGGNQRNKVSAKRYHKRRIVAVRRPDCTSV